MAKPKPQRDTFLEALRAIVSISKPYHQGMADDATLTSRERWEASATKALRGASLESLVNTTLDGIEIAPLYTRAAVAHLRGDEMPGSGSFRRGGTANATATGWEMRQTHHCGTDGVNSAILDDLEKGITAITLKDVTDVDLLDVVLDGVHLDMVPIHLAPGSRGPALRALMALWERRGHDPAEMSGCFGVDPVATLARRGWLTHSLDDGLATSTTFAIRASDTMSGIAVYDIDGTAFSDAGASDAQEIAAVLSGGVRYLRAMVEEGLAVETAARQLQFSISVGPDQFAGIAKLRAARQCWARIVESSGGIPTARGMYIHAITAYGMITRHDPWVNMLRTTTAAFAAAVGGADAITVTPFDSGIGHPSELGHRIARNTQSILCEESLIGAVVDPAGGSWYVEDLTSKLADKAWTHFQAVEARGGIGAALLEGSAQSAVAGAVAERHRRVATRADGLVGTSEYPTLDEVAVAIPSSPSAPVPGDDAVITCEVLMPRRWSQTFDELRAVAAAASEPPTAFLANLGPPAVHNARATFATNLLASGGVRAIDGTRLDDTGLDDTGLDDTDAVLSSFAASHAHAAVICSSDAVYSQRAAATAAALKAAGCKWVLLAGGPGESADALRASGVDDFIHVGCDVVEALTHLHGAIGVAR